MEHQIFQIIGIICLISNTAILVIVAQNKASTIQKLGMLLATAGVTVQLGNFFLLFSSEYESLLNAMKLKTIGHILILTSFILFVNVYCGVKLSPFTKTGVVAFNLVSIGLCLTCEYHDLFYSEIVYVSDAAHPHILTNISYFDIGYRVVNVVFILILSIRVAKMAFDISNVKKGKDFLILLSIAVAFVSDLINSMKITEVYDLFAIGFAISALILIIAAYRYGILDTMQLAKENVLEHTTEGVIVVGIDKKLVYANNKAQALLPYLKESDDISTEKQLKEIFDGERSMIKTDSGQYEAKISPLYESGILKGYMALLIDMSFIERYTKEVIELKEVAEAANRSKSVFLANMSHEIRTPMNAIVGFNELILQKSKDKQILNYANDIKTSSDNLLSIINDVLDLSRIESGKMELSEKEYKLNELIKESTINVKSMADKKGLELIVDIDENLPYKLYGDNSHIRNILINLLNNAVKYTPVGFIKFVIKLEDMQDDNAVLRFSVADSGIGIKEDDIPRLFDEFEKFDSKKNCGVEGTGLGLAIVKGYTELLGGKITVESEYGLGSTFTLVVSQKIVSTDRLIQDKWVEEEESHVRKKFQAPNARILITDDNEINLKVSSSILRTYGIRVDTALSGKEAIDACRTEPYDIIFMDQMMPEMDGVEAMKRIRTLLDDSTYRSVIVALTANAVSGVKEQMYKEGFDDYITKPIDVVYLEKVLLKFLPQELIIYEDNQVEDVTEIVDEQPDIISAQNESGTKKETIEDCLTGFDIAKGISCCGGDIECYEEILQAYYESGEKRLAELASLFDEKNYKNYVIAVHGLKSSSASIGAMELSECAKAHEFAGKEERYQFVHDDFLHLKELYQTALDKIYDALVLRGIIAVDNKDESGDTGIQISEELIDIAVKRIKDMLFDYDYSGALRILEQLMDCKLPETKKADIDSLKKAIDEENVKEIYNILRRI